MKMTTVREVSMNHVPIDVDNVRGILLLHLAARDRFRSLTMKSFVSGNAADSRSQAARDMYTSMCSAIVSANLDKAADLFSNGLVARFGIEKLEAENFTDLILRTNSHGAVEDLLAYLVAGDGTLSRNARRAKKVLVNSSGDLGMFMTCDKLLNEFIPGWRDLAQGRGIENGLEVADAN